MAIAGLDATGMLELAALLVVTGALAGFLAGVFGIGGGAVLVPVFYECFRLAGVPLEVRMPLCVGTSLAVIIPTSIRSFRAHYLRGAVDMAIIKEWWLSIVLGVIAGSVTARYAPERLFKFVFVGVAWSAAARLFLARDNWKFGDKFPVLISIPGAIGYVYAGWPAAAHFPEVAALQWPFALGYVSLNGALLVMPTSLVTAPIGVKAAHALSKRKLEIAFGCYLLIVGGRFVVSLMTGQ
jgi:uncharacterized membrane protein YfcA